MPRGRAFGETSWAPDRRTRNFSPWPLWRLSTTEPSLLKEFLKLLGLWGAEPCQTGESGRDGWPAVALPPRWCTGGQAKARRGQDCRLPGEKVISGTRSGRAFKPLPGATPLPKRACWGDALSRGLAALISAVPQIVLLRRPPPPHSGLWGRCRPDQQWLAPPRKNGQKVAQIQRVRWPERGELDRVPRRF